MTNVHLNDMMLLLNKARYFCKIYFLANEIQFHEKKYAISIETLSIPFQDPSVRK